MCFHSMGWPGIHNLCRPSVLDEILMLCIRDCCDGHRLGCSRGHWTSRLRRSTGGTDDRGGLGGRGGRGGLGGLLHLDCSGEVKVESLRWGWGIQDDDAGEDEDG